MKVAVIGAGIGGLATAIRLAAKSHQVTVFEKNATPGGKMSEYRVGKYRFDTGPSLFTLPELTKELFCLCGENIQDHLPYKRLDTNCKYFYADGSSFTFYQDKDRLIRELDKKGINDKKAVLGRLAKSKEVYELSAPLFLFSNFHKLSNFRTPPYKNVASKLHKLDFLRTMHGANKHDFKDRRMIQLFDRYATYNGSNPYKAPATLNMIAHLENNIGAFFPEKGMYSIVCELYNLAVRKGVEFRFSEKVDEILIQDKKAVGLRSHDQKEYYDLIISAVDVKYLSQNLVRRHPMRRRLKMVESSSSALIFYWSIKKDFSELDLHNILFTHDYHSEFNHLFNRKIIFYDPTVYIFISSKIVQDDAPRGCSNWFVMINTPANTGQDWYKLIATARKSIIRKINETLKLDIEKYIVHENMGSPITIEKQTMSASGALYGASSNSMWSAFMRHPNTLKSIRNLYFVGGSVHPGGGIPLCLASARIVCDEINAMHEN